MYKSYILSAGLLLTSFAAQAQSPAVATFEDLGLAPESIWDGSDESAMFQSGDFLFINNYVDWGGYASWDGFAYSTMTSTQYASLDDQYNSCVGSGVNGSATYAVAYYSAYMGTEPTVMEAEGNTFTPTGCYITNNAYAYLSMLNGDAYSKQFDATDWFLLTATGYLDGEATAQAEFYLAKDGTIVNDWQWFDLSALGAVDEIHFTLSSSDTGAWGMNTPAYFCMDNFGDSHAITNITAPLIPSSVNHSYNLLGQPTTQSDGLVIRDGKIRFTRK